MKRRLLLVPVVVAPVAAVAIWTGYIWPVMTTAWSVLAPRETQETEFDLLV